MTAFANRFVQADASSFAYVALIDAARPIYIADLNARIGLPANLRGMGVTQAHFSDATRDYAVSDLATMSNAVPFDGEKYSELFARAL